MFKVEKKFKFVNESLETGITTGTLIMPWQIDSNKSVRHNKINSRECLSLPKMNLAMMIVLAMM